jgi:hypothetical protein
MVFICCLAVCSAAEVLPGQDLGDLNRCGPIALQVCATVSGRTTGAREIDEIMARDGHEWSLEELQSCARQLGLYTLAVKWRRVPLSIEAPAIIRIRAPGGNHFISLVGRKADDVLIVDPPFDPSWVPISRLESELAWDGYALHVASSPLPILVMSLYVHAREVVLIVGLLVLFGGVLRILRRRQRAVVRRIGDDNLSDENHSHDLATQGNGR